MKRSMSGPKAFLKDLKPCGPCKKPEGDFQESSQNTLICNDCMIDPRIGPISRMGLIRLIGKIIFASGERRRWKIFTGSLFCLQ